MKVIEENYCIASKTLPLKFYDHNGNESNFIEPCVLFFDKEECEKELKIYDEPNEYQIIKVKVTYEF